MSNKIILDTSYSVLGDAAPNTAAEVPSTVKILSSDKFYYLKQPFQLTIEQLKMVVENFNKKVQKVDLSVNYDHSFLKGRGSKAAGWIKELSFHELDQGQAYINADIEWTNRAKNKIFEREFRFTSIEMDTNYIDPIDGVTDHGYTLIGLALTNQPANVTLPPMVAEKGEKNMLELEKLKQEMKDMKDMYEKKMKEMKDMYEKKMKEGHVKKMEAEKDKEILALSAKNKELTDCLDKKEREIEINKLILEKKMVPAQREKALALNKDAYEGFKIALDTSDTKFETSPESKGESVNSDTTISFEAAEKKIIAMSKELAVKGEIEFGEALTKVLTDNKKLADIYNKGA